MLAVGTIVAELATADIERLQAGYAAESIGH
jgi:hypothetical protein